jgi:spoIIIJ-associated protein
MQRSVEVEARTLEEAMKTALKELGVTREQVDIEIVDDAKSGFLGFGSKLARVKATLKNAGGKRESVDDSSIKPEYSEAVSTQGGTVEADERSADVPQPPDAELAEAFLATLIEKMKMEGKIETGSRDGRICLNVSGQDSSILIGKNGQTLEAIQFLINLMYSKKTKSRAGILVDVEEYRVRREKKLRAMALEASEKAKRDSRAVTIAPMNAQDRRVIHIALQDDEEVKTISRGEGILKKVVVIPK